MAYLRRRVVKGKHGAAEYYQILESYRQDGQPKQRVICNLGRHPSPKEAEAKARRRGFNLVSKYLAACVQCGKPFDLTKGVTAYYEGRAFVIKPFKGRCPKCQIRDYYLPYPFARKKEHCCPKCNRAWVLHKDDGSCFENDKSANEEMEEMVNQGFRRLRELVLRGLWGYGVVGLENVLIKQMYRERGVCGKRSVKKEKEGGFPEPKAKQPIALAS